MFFRHNRIDTFLLGVKSGDNNHMRKRQFESSNCDDNGKKKRTKRTLSFWTEKLNSLTLKKFQAEDAIYIVKKRLMINPVGQRGCRLRNAGSGSCRLVNDFVRFTLYRTDKPYLKRIERRRRWLQNRKKAEGQLAAANSKLTLLTQHIVYVKVMIAKLQQQKP
jgi:hypothetical protein